MAKKMTKKPVMKKSAKIEPSKKPRTKSSLYGTIAEQTDLTRKQVAGVFESMATVMQADLTKGCGKFQVPGLMRVVKISKPATKAREGKNPFTGEPMMIKAKPARNIVRVRPLKHLKAMV
ncbi:MAG TPA: HU family DNA-binding protein [Phycisphaerales bacterium]|nr:HU family DNA-binding protein [Phycisphaerales bacterium]